jgi:hypothetical protein
LTIPLPARKLPQTAAPDGIPKQKQAS